MNAMHARETELSGNKLRLYLTKYGANTNINEHGAVVRVVIDNNTQVSCLLKYPGTEGTEIMTMESGELSHDSQLNLDTFAEVSDYILFMKNHKKSTLTTVEKKDRFFDLMGEMPMDELIE
jgi:hypothetical protein